MTNRIEQAVGCDDGDSAVKIIQDALGIEFVRNGSLGCFSATMRSPQFPIRN